MIDVDGPTQLVIRDALRAAFGTRAGIDELLTAVDKSFDDFEVAGNQFTDTILVVVKNAVRDDWIVALLATASQRREHDALLKSLLDDLQALPQVPVPVVSEPAAELDVDKLFKTCRLTGRYVMVNRSDLRTSLQRMNDARGERILVVRGEAKTGKSHTAHFISFLADELGKFAYVFIDLSDLLAPGEPVEPDAVARNLLDQLEYDLRIPRTPDHRQWATWNRQVCNDLRNKARNDPRSRWIVIDAFNSATVTDNTIDFIKQLALRVSQTLSRFRLILLGFDGELPPELWGHLAQEDIAPIDAQHVTEFFFSAYTQARLPIDVARIAATALRVLAGLDPQSPDYLLKLAPRVSDELAQALTNGQN